MLVLWFDRHRPEALLGECRAYYEQRGIAFRLHGEGLPELAEGETLLAFGGRALEALKKAGLLPKNRALGSLRGKAHAYPPDAKLFLTYDPQIIAVDYARKADIYWDLQLAARADRTGTTLPVLGEYRYVPDFSEALAEIARRFKATGRPVPVALDLETVGTDHVDPEAGIVSVALTVSAGRSDMVRFTPPSLSAESVPTALIGQLQTLATDIRRVRVRGANFKFDQLWMWAKWGIEAWPTFVFDTTLVGSLLDENRSNSLSLHAKLFTDLGGYDDALNARYDKARMDLVPDDDLLVYGGGDTDATYRTSEVFARALVRDKKLTGFYQHLLHRAAQAVMVMERRGIVVDRERYAQVEAEVQGVKEAAEQRALAMLPGRLRAKYLDNLSLTRSRLVCDFMFSSLGLSLRPQLFTPKDDSPSTSLAHLEAVAQGHAEAEQFVAAMREWQQAQKTHSTYITGFLKHLRADGRYHPSYMLYRGTFGDSDDVSGAVTGRTACKEPAYQTMPKHTRWAKLLRTVYTPPPGHAILKADYSQGELRVVACVANEKIMLDTYRKGIDLHLKTGAEVYGLTLEQALAMSKSKNPADLSKVARIRQGGKAGNFGLIYEMQAAGFVSYARSTFGVELTTKQGAAFYDRFFSAYPGLKAWHRQSKSFAHEHRAIRSPLGRVRRLPLINSRNSEVRALQERQAINSPIQATLSDMGLFAIAELHARYPELWVFGFTHDDLGAYVPLDEVDLWVGRLREVMENLPLDRLGWHPQLQFPVDVDISETDLASVRKYRAT